MADTTLHICSSFARQKLYSELVAALDAEGVEQVVYAPVRTATEAISRPPALPDRVQCHIEHVLKPAHRLLFRTKVRTVTQAVSGKVDLTEIACTHAHFLYSDGAVALKLKQQYGIPFVAAVRNTDLNVFRVYRPDLNGLARRVLLEAGAVVFLSPVYRERYLDGLGAQLMDRIAEKSLVVPNGLTGDWLRPLPPAARESAVLKLLMVSDFSANKNLANTLAASRIVAASRPVELTLAGGNSRTERKVRRRLAEEDHGFVRYIGRIDSPEELRAVYRDHDILIMPSFKETFGLVYIEALSQGLPVIHSRGEGIDGFFENARVSEAVDPTDPRDIARGIEALAVRCEDVRGRCIAEAASFDWAAIARRYAEIYASIRRT